MCTLNRDLNADQRFGVYNHGANIIHLFQLCKKKYSQENAIAVNLV